MADEALRGLHGLVTGANELDTHLRGVEPGATSRPSGPTSGAWRRATATPAAPRSASSPRSRSATSSSSARATRCPSARATWTSRASEQPIVMGSYGIGPARIVAAAIEQFHDEQGITWPRALAPVRHRAGHARQGGRGGARGRRPPLRRAARRGLRRALRGPRRQRGGEVRRRRAARLPAAADDRQARARGGPGRRPDQARPGAALAPARRRSSQAAAELWTSLP